MKILIIVALAVLSLMGNNFAENFSDKNIEIQNNKNENKTGLIFTGTIVSSDNKMISSIFMGYITKTNFKPGDIVKKGQVMFSVDSNKMDKMILKLKSSIIIQKNNLDISTSNKNYIKEQLEKHKRLVKKDMVSQFEVDNLALKYKNSISALNMNIEQVKLSEYDLKQVMGTYKYLNVKAPNNGVIVSKFKKSGEMSLPGVPVYELLNLDDLEVHTEIGESNFNLIEIGNNVQVRIPSINYKTKGYIYSIIPSLNPMSHKFKIVVKFKNLKKKRSCSKNKNIECKTNRILPGMYVKVHI